MRNLLNAYYLYFKLHRGLSPPPPTPVAYVLTSSANAILLFNGTHLDSVHNKSPVM